MKVNEHTAVVTPKIHLIPYCKHHVPKYHDWMQDEVCSEDFFLIHTRCSAPAELQQLTASEPLELDEEYEMQASWRNDHDKLTFIVCLPPPPVPKAEHDGVSNGPALPPPPVVIRSEDEEKRMIGDINLFLSPCHDEADEDENGEAQHERSPKKQRIAAPQTVLGEIELMVASEDLRGRGYGFAILQTFIWYISTHLSPILAEYAAGVKVDTVTLEYLRVKVDQGNWKSLRLFERAGFRRVSEKPNYFGELELRRQIRGLDVVRGDGKIEIDGVDEPRIAVYSLGETLN